MVSWGANPGWFYLFGVRDEDPDPVGSVDFVACRIPYFYHWIGSYL